MMFLNLQTVVCIILHWQAFVPSFPVKKEIKLLMEIPHDHKFPERFLKSNAQI